MKNPDWAAALLSTSLPEGFAFYHLGHVELQPESASTGTSPLLTSEEERAIDLGIDQFVSDMRPAIAISMHGDLEATFILLVGVPDELSTYSEMANLIVSQMATRLANEKGLDVLIGPPQSLTAGQLRKLVSLQGDAAIRRTYRHRHDGKTLNLEALIFARSPSHV